MGESWETGRGWDLRFVAEFAGEDHFFLAGGVVELWVVSMSWEIGGSGKLDFKRAAVEIVLEA